MNKPAIHFHSRGKSGNIFWILGAAQTTLHEQQRITDFNELRDRVFSSNGYADALAVIREYVDLIDDDGKV